MKILKSLASIYLSIILLLISFTVNDTSAQSLPIDEITNNKYALDNLIAGIKSENCGVKRSAIYFAGKYRIKEVQDVLLDELKSENESCTRILMALVLYELGNTDGLILVSDMIKNDEDKNPRRMATDMYYRFLKNDY
jgi:hypothetical protein